MIKGILFDKDGTLIEFQGVWHEIIRRILMELANRYQCSQDVIEKLKAVSGYTEDGFAPESMIQYATTTQITELWYDVILHSGEQGKGRMNYKDLLQLFEEKSLEEDIEFHAVQGARELLEFLKEKDYILGIATADTFHSSILSLEKAGILPYFQYIGCNEDGMKPKPERDMAIRFCSRFEIKPEELLIVGDSVVDMQFAENAGANFIGIQAAYNDYSTFHAHNWQSVTNIRNIIQSYGL